MTEASGALLTSIVSVVIAFFALGWNVYRDVIDKPKGRVTIGKRLLLGGPHDATVIGCSVVNFGPGRLQLQMPILRRRFFLPWRRKHNMDGVIMHQPIIAGSGQLPATLEVGDTLTLLWPWTDEGFVRAQPTGIALVDTFGKYHWAKRKQVQQLNRDWVKDFPDANRFQLQNKSIGSDTDARQKREATTI